MVWNIDDREVEELAAEIASRTGESKTAAVREALRERNERLAPDAGRIKHEPGSMLRFLETEIWPLIPAEERGKPPMTKAEREELLGYGPEGY